MSAEILTPAELAERLKVSREYVYANADRLGALRLGSGPKARLRFDWQKVEAALTTDSPPAPEPKAKPRKRRTQKAGNVRLLASRGEGPYADSANKAAPGGASTPTEGLTTEV